MGKLINYSAAFLFKTQAPPAGCGAAFSSGTTIPECLAVFGSISCRRGKGGIRTQTNVHGLAVGACFR